MTTQRDFEQQEPRTDLLDAWQTEMRASDLSERTVCAWRSIAERAAAATGVDPDGLTTAGCAFYLAGFTNSNTRSTYYIGLQAWSRWLVTRGHRPDNPLDGLRKPRAPKGQPRPVSNLALYRLLGTPMSPRCRAMVLLACYQGLRVSEVARVRGQDVDTEQGVLRVVGKGNKPATLPLHPEIAELAERMPRHGWWFPCRDDARRPVVGRTVTSHISEAMRRANIPGTPHSLRHWYGTSLLRGGADLRIVQSLMRHSSLATTQVYLEVTDTELAAAVRRLPTLGGDR